ncbi:hypothetical protein GQ457_02G041520 [Hibiscus cannabinus]
MFSMFFMNMKNNDPEPPRTTTGRQQPVTAPPLRRPPLLAPATAHGGRTLKNSSFFPITRIEAPQHLTKIKNLRSTRIVSLIGDAPQR